MPRDLRARVTPAISGLTGFYQATPGSLEGACVSSGFLLEDWVGLLDFLLLYLRVLKGLEHESLVRFDLALQDLFVLVVVI